MLTVTLHRADHAPEQVHVHTIEQASATATAFRDKWEMMSSDCGMLHGVVYHGKTMLYMVSYNGRVWRAINPFHRDGLVFDPAV